MVGAYLECGIAEERRQKVVIIWSSTGEKSESVDYFVFIAC
jgi:hypothetical protein